MTVVTVVFWCKPFI